MPTPERTYTLTRQFSFSATSDEHAREIVEDLVRAQHDIAELSYSMRRAPSSTLLREDGVDAHVVLHETRVFDSFEGAWKDEEA